MKKNLSVLLLVFIHFLVSAQPQNLPGTSAGFPVNYSEDSVGTYVLPDPLMMSNGQKVRHSKTWTQKRRPELVKLFEEIEYGKMPPRPADMHFHVFDKGIPAFNGKAIRKQVTVYFTKDTNANKMDLLIYLPSDAREAVPLLLNISFVTNNQVTDDPGVKTGSIWTREGKKVNASGPSRFGKMNIEQFITEGIGFACVYYGNIEPDFKDGVKYGIRSQYLKPGQMTPAANEWGAISAWAWGLSRAMDYFETDKQAWAKADRNSKAEDIFSCPYLIHLFVG